MTAIYIDFETYYDRDYSLSKMSTEEYIRDARFKAQSVMSAAPGYATGLPLNCSGGYAKEHSK
jgi:hypothetical protein